MGTRILPDTPASEMDESHLTRLIREALVAFNDFIRARDFQTETIRVFGPQMPGKSYQVLDRPVLLDALVADQKARMKLPAAKALMDYLWEHGAHPLSLSRDDGDPDRESWASNAFHIIIANTLYRLWDEESVRSGSANGTWQPWEVPEYRLDQHAGDIASIELRKGARVTVTIPLLQLTLMNIESFELEPGVVLRTWRQEDKAVYLHRNERIYPFDDVFGPHNSKSYLTIVANSKDVFKGGENHEAIEKFISMIVARVKWAIMQATNPSQLITELPATTEIYQSTLGVLPIRRQRIQRRLKGAIRLDVDGCRSASKLLENFKNVAAAFPDIGDVMWMFDRATLATLPRDILFESAMGLERLLVSGSGETTRRFKHYGTAILSDGDPPKTCGELSAIYDLRSTAAHGIKIASKQFDELAITARTYLSKAIERVVRLAVAHNWQSSKKVSTVNVAVENYLLSLLYTAAHQDFNNIE